MQLEAVGELMSGSLVSLGVCSSEREDVFGRDAEHVFSALS